MLLFCAPWYQERRHPTSHQGAGLAPKRSKRVQEKCQRGADQETGDSLSHRQIEPGQDGGTFFDYSISPRDKAIEAVARELLKTARHQSQNKLAWNRWAGAEEIFATIFYFREMIYVFDCLPTGEAYAQLYHLVWDEKHKEETVCITPIPPWEIGDHIRMHLGFM